MEQQNREEKCSNQFECLNKTIIYTWGQNYYASILFPKCLDAIMQAYFYLIFFYPLHKLRTDKDIYKVILYSKFI